jgi:hypothetical protein
VRGAISLRQRGIGISPFPVSPSRGKPGGPPPPLRYGSGTAPAQSRTLDRVLGRKGTELLDWGLRPLAPSPAGLRLAGILSTHPLRRYDGSEAGPRPKPPRAFP